MRWGGALVFFINQPKFSLSASHCRVLEAAKPFLLTCWSSMSLCLCIAVFVYLYLGNCIWVFVFGNLYLVICILVFVFVYLYLFICICVFVFVLLYLCLRICLCIFPIFYSLAGCLRPGKLQKRDLIVVVPMVWDVKATHHD